MGSPCGPSNSAQTEGLGNTLPLVKKTSHRTDSFINNLKFPVRGTTDILGIFQEIYGHLDVRLSVTKVLRCSVPQKS